MLARILAVFLLTVVIAHAEVTVPEFSFTGEEITSHEVKPTFTAVSFRFNTPSQFDAYLQTNEFTLKEAEEKGYQSEDPGSLYSGSFGTSFSSLFIGEKAYRNHIVRLFRDQQYIMVIAAYDKLSPDLKNPEYKDEARFLYGLSLVLTASRTEGLAVLREIAEGSGTFRDIAMDKFVALNFETGDNNAVVNFGMQQDILTPYAFNVLAYALLKERRYDDILDIFVKHPGIRDEHPSLTDFLVSAWYFKGDMDEVLPFADNVSDNTRAFVADAMIMTGETDEIEEYLVKITNPSTRAYLTAKYYASMNDTALALPQLKQITSDNDQMGLLLYYIGRSFPQVDPAFLQGFSFQSKQHADYVHHYLGLYYLANGNPAEAVKRLDRVTFNKDLIVQDYFYRGMAYVHIDTSRAEFYFIKYMNEAPAGERGSIARFMLAQLRYHAEKYDDALMLVDDCDRDYCMKLKAEINIIRKDYQSALGLAKGLQGDTIAMVRASSHYNLKQYQSALGELQSIKSPNRDSDYLLMMTHFKLGNIDAGGKVFQRHGDDPGFFEAGVRHLFLAGKYDAVLVHLEKRNDLTDEFDLMKAKILSGKGKYAEAELIYERLTERGYSLYDSISGLLGIYLLRGEKEKYLDKGFALLKSTPVFERKDLIVVDAVKVAQDENQTTKAIDLLNYFFKHFRKSPYTGDAYYNRAKLYKITGQFKLCVRDTDRVLANPSGDVTETLYLKAECLESYDSDAAMMVYTEMVKAEGRFVEPASKKVMLLSKRPADVIAAAERLRKTDPSLFYQGVLRYLEMIKPSTLVEEEQRLTLLIKSGDENNMAAGYYFTAQMMLQRNELAQATRYHMKGYYLFPKTEFGKKNLTQAAILYDRRGKKKEADSLKKLLKTLK